MRQRASEALVVTITLAVCAVWLMYAAVQRPYSISGDPWAVYFPVVQGLWRGHGFASFATLIQSGIRMPGYPIALGAASLLTPDLVHAGQIVGIVSALAVCGLVMMGMRRAGASLVASTLPPLVMASHREFSRAALECLPDMLYLALFCGAVVVALKLLKTESPQQARRSALGLGMLAAFGFLVRVNGVALLLAFPLLLRLCMPRPLFGAALRDYLRGSVLGLLPWLVLIVAMQKYVGYPHIQASSSGAIASASDAGPVLAVLIAIGRGLCHQPWRVVASVPWWLALAGLVTLALSIRRSRLALLITGMGVVMAGLLVPMHFEARYYLFLAPLLLPAAVIGIEHLLRRTSRPWLAPLAILLASGPALLVQAPEAIAANRLQANIGVKLERVCMTLDAMAKNSTHPLVVGVATNQRYSRFAQCPHPWRGGNDSVVLVQTTPTARGLDVWLALPNETAPTAMPLLAAVEGHRLYASAKVDVASLDGGALLLPTTLALTVPERRGCRDQLLQVTAGSYRMQAFVEVTRGVLARLSLAQANQQVAAFTTRSGQIELGEMRLADGELRASLCVENKLVYGAAAWRGLRVRRL